MKPYFFKWYIFLKIFSFFTHSPIKNCFFFIESVIVITEKIFQALKKSHRQTFIFLTGLFSMSFHYKLYKFLSRLVSSTYIINCNLVKIIGHFFKYKILQVRIFSLLIREISQKLVNLSYKKQSKKFFSHLYFYYNTTNTFSTVLQIVDVDTFYYYMQRKN